MQNSREKNKIISLLNQYIDKWSSSNECDDVEFYGFIQKLIRPKVGNGETPAEIWAGPILESKGMHMIFQKKGKKFSLLHMKITASVTKSSHRDRSPCYLHLPIFFFYIHSSLLQQNKKLLQSLFSLANQTTDHYSVIYTTRLFQCGD